MRGLLHVHSHLPHFMASLEKASGLIKIAPGPQTNSIRHPAPLEAFPGSLSSGPREIGILDPEAL